MKIWKEDNIEFWKKNAEKEGYLLRMGARKQERNIDGSWAKRRISRRRGTGRERRESEKTSLGKQIRFNSFRG